VKDIAQVPRTKLEVRDLQLVQALSAAGSTSRAAALVHLTQPAVSRALCSLEARLGVSLFERSAQGLVPTAAGERLLEGARELLVGLCDLEQRVRAPAPPSRLRIVCECYTAYHWLPSALTALRSHGFGLDVALEVAHTAAPASALTGGDVDAALLTTARVEGKDVLERPLFSDEVVFVLAKTHPLAAKKVITREDLASSVLVTSSNTPQAEQVWFMRAVFGRSKPRLRFERLPLTEAILDVTRAGLGVAALSAWIAGPHLNKGDLCVRRLDTGPLQRPWRYAYRREHSEAAMRLFAVLQTAAPRVHFER